MDLKTIAIGSDHAAFQLKQEVMRHLESKGIKFKDFGCYEPASINYAPIAAKVGRAVASGECKLGILLCGTGIGMSIAANKVKGIRAAACSDYFGAKYTRLHNDANILCLGSRVVGAGLALELVDVFLSTGFEGGRHSIRVDEITSIEEGKL